MDPVDDQEGKGSSSNPLQVSRALPLDGLEAGGCWMVDGEQSYEPQPSPAPCSKQSSKSKESSLFEVVLKASTMGQLKTGRRP